MTRLARVLDGNMRELRRLHPTQQSVDDRVTPLSTASLTLPEGEHAAFGEWVEVFTQNGSAGVYRVVSASETYTGEASAELEHGICALGDAIIPGKGTISGTLSQVLSTMLGYQVVTAGGAPLWALGSVETDEQASFEHEGTNLLSAVLEIVPDGYILTFDQSALPWRLGVAKMATTAECEGRLSRNLRGVTVTVDEEDHCTRIYCNMLPSPGYMDGPTVGTWGIKAKTITAQENVTQESLTAYITQYLEDHKNPRVSIECDAEDLSSITGETIDRLEKGRLFRLALPDYGVAMEERILAVHTGSAYDEPERVRLTLANSIRDTADTLVYLDNVLTGGASSSSARGGGGRKSVRDELTDVQRWATIQIDEANAKINLNAGEINKVEERVSQAEIDIDGANAQIELKASQTTVDALGERVSSAEINIDGANAKIELKVSKDGVISSINQTAESVKIKASRIELSGYVTASQLSALEARFDNLTSGVTQAALINTQNLMCNGPVTLRGHSCNWSSLEVCTGVHYSKEANTIPATDGLNYYVITSVKVWGDYETINFMSY
ncbi:MAG: phage tail protein [Clostridiales bacterium]|nr:phage tail protein [Clostridiales bacterium]